MPRLLGGAIAANNPVVRRFDAEHRNPRPLDEVAWHGEVTRRYDHIRSEWDAFAAAGGRLPRIEQLLGEDQGNDGGWRAGLVVSAGRPVRPLATRFPATVAALGCIPGLRFALWSFFEPGVELPEHQGPNAGVLRYHLVVVEDGGSALQVAGTTVPYRAGTGILFDDTAPHAAWNRGTTPRITLMCEVLRPLPRPASTVNALVQAGRAIDGRFRRAPARAAEWDHALNPHL